MAVAQRQSVAAPLELAGRKPRSLWADAWERLLRNRLAVAGIVVIVLYTVIAIFAPWVAPHDPVQLFPGKTQLDPIWVSGSDPQFPLGTDTAGRDILSRLIYGSRISLSIGFVPLLIVLVIGAPVGLVAGYAGGRVDNWLMRIVDVVYAFPDFLFLIIMIASFRQTAIGQAYSGLLLMFIALSLVSWVGLARLVRGQVLSLKEKEFVEAARCLGASPRRIIFKHLLPNTLAPIIVSSAFTIPGAIISEAILSYLGVGIIPPTPSWGSLILDGYQSIYSLPQLLVAPSVCLALLVMSFTFLGDGLRDALDPRLK